VRRNPLKKDLRTPKYRLRVYGKKKYKRRKKIDESY